MKRLLLIFTMLLPASISTAQDNEHVKWTFITEPGENEGEINLVITANLEHGWHVYSQILEDGGPLPTKISITNSNDYVLIGGVKEKGSPVVLYNKEFGMNTTYYANQVSFVQTVKLINRSATISGKVAFMLCSGRRCLLPTDVKFSVKSESSG